MQNIKRIGAIGGAVVLVLCWPLAVGQIGQKAITHGLENLTNEQISAELIHYDRGYLSSHVSARFTVLDERVRQQLISEGLPTQWIVDSDIQHQLFSLSAQSRLPEYPELPLTMTTVTQLNGNTDYHIQLDSWHYQPLDNEALGISLTPAQLTGTVTTLGEVTYDLTLPSVMVDFIDGQKMQLSKLEAKGHGKQENGFWLGKQALSIGELEINDSDHQSLLLVRQGSYEFTSSMDAHKKRFTSQHKLTVDQVISDEGEVHDATFDFTLADVDSQAFEQLSALYQTYSTMPAQALNQALPLIETLFSQGFSLSLNQLAVKVGDGDFSANWMLTIPEGTNNILQDPSVILPALTGHLDNFVSQQFAQDYPFIQQGMDELVMMEMASQDEQGYRIRAQINQGNVSFDNGKQVPLISLMMPLLMR
ncbi:DUF945 family protein [Vibrio metschnikovii]|uniref:DUF945 family protein n=1 Tax=Vibrio metschnikovii TaxID=28172 RepID=UPI001C2F9FE5|nr:DUF945 family protein [Vibrio metschnikovii]